MLHNLRTIYLAVFVNEFCVSNENDMSFCMSDA